MIPFLISIFFNILIYILTTAFPLLFNYSYRQYKHIISDHISNNLPSQYKYRRKKKIIKKNGKKEEVIKKSFLLLQTQKEDLRAKYRKKNITK